MWHQQQEMPYLITITRTSGRLCLLVRLYLDYLEFTHHACDRSVLSCYNGKRLCHFFRFLLPNFYLFFTDYCAHFESIIKFSWHEDNITLNFICWLGGRWDKHNIKYLSNSLRPAGLELGEGWEHLLVIELTEIARGVDRWQHQPPVLRGSVLGSCGGMGEFEQIKTSAVTLSIFVSGTCLSWVLWNEDQWCFYFIYFAIYLPWQPLCFWSFFWAVCFPDYEHSAATAV